MFENQNNPNRRKVLGFLGLGAVSMTRVPEVLADLVPEPSSPTTLPHEIPTITPISETLPPDWHIVPECERELSTVAFTWTEEVVNAVTAQKNNPIKDFFSDVLQGAPGYSRVLLVIPATIPEGYYGHIQDFFRTYGKQPPVIITHTGNVEMWAQDIGEPVQHISGKVGMLRSVPASTLTTLASAERIRNYQNSLDLIASPHIFDTPFYFEGGNFMPHRTQEGRVGIMMGFRDVRHNQELTHDGTSSIDEVKENISKYFNNASVTVLGSEISKYAFHIDHGCLILPDMQALVGEVSAQDILNEYEKGTLSDDELKELMIVSRLFSEYAKTLTSIGYRVSRIKHTAQDCINGHFSMNAVVFKHKETKKVTALLPVYEGEYETNSSTPITLKGKALEMHALLENQGIHVVPVRDYANTSKNVLRGSVHCMTQVMAEAFQPSSTTKV